VPPAALQAIAEGEPPSPMALVRAVGPRLLRDILGPPVAFYAGWKLTGNVFIGVAIATLVAVVVYLHERRQGRPGLIARVVLLFVLVQAIVGVATDSATAYLVQPALLGAINGALWLGSVAVGRPLAGTFAREVFTVDDQTRASEEYRSVFHYISVLFGVFFLSFAVVQLAVLLIVGVGAFLLTRLVDAAGTLAMIGYAVRHISHHLGARLSI
jgi:uncharacterized membrane protein